MKETSEYEEQLELQLKWREFGIFKGEKELTQEDRKAIYDANENEHDFLTFIENYPQYEVANFTWEVKQAHLNESMTQKAKEITFAKLFEEYFGGTPFWANLTKADKRLLDSFEGRASKILKEAV